MFTFCCNRQEVEKKNKKQKKSVSLSLENRLRRRPRAVRGGLGERSSVGGSWCCSSWRGRWGAGLNLGLELGHLLRAGQCLQQGVLLFQLGVTLDQLLDLLLQDLHLLTHSVHQVALHQVLRVTKTHLFFVLGAK